MNIVLAIFFFVLGVIGILVPIMPQFIFFALSLIFLSLVSKRVHRGVQRFLRNHPKMNSAYHRWRHKVRAKRRAKKRERTARRS